MRCTFPVGPFGISSTTTMLARHLERRELLGDEVLKFALARPPGPGRHDRRGHLLAEQRIGIANVTACRDGRVAQERLVDLERRDLLAAPVDDLLEPAR